MAATPSSWRTLADPATLEYTNLMASITPTDIATIDLGDLCAHVTQKHYDAAKEHIHQNTLDAVRSSALAGDREMKFELALRILSGFTCSSGRRIGKTEKDDAQLKLIGLAQELGLDLETDERAGRGARRKRTPEVYDLTPRVHRLAALTLLETARADAALL